MKSPRSYLMSEIPKLMAECDKLGVPRFWHGLPLTPNQRLIIWSEMDALDMRPQQLPLELDYVN